MSVQIDRTTWIGVYLNDKEGLCCEECGAGIDKSILISHFDTDTHYGYVLECECGNRIRCFTEWDDDDPMRGQGGKSMQPVDIAAAIQDMIENKIYAEWKHEGYIDALYSTGVVADIDGKKYMIEVKEI